MKTISFYLQVLPLALMVIVGLLDQNLNVVALIAAMTAFFGGAYQLLHTIFWVIAKHKLNLHQYAILRNYVLGVGLYFLVGIGLLIAQNYIELVDNIGIIYITLAAPLYLLHTYFSYCVAFEKQAFSSGNRFLNNIQL